MAVLPVIFFHAGIEGFSGGFVGVDVFFVISGYLITTIIIAELDAKTFSLADFYERRARRILPALYAVMFTSLIAAWLFLMPADLHSFAQSLVAVPAFASNILFWQAQGYFAPAAELAPLLHTWSLAVEEQYYLVFPVLLILAWRWGRRYTLLLLAILACVSLALAQWASAYQPLAAFYLLPMRGWELLLGAFAAFYLNASDRPPSAAAGELGAMLGASLIIAAVVTFDKHTPFPGVYALVPAIGSVLIILFAAPTTWVGSVLGSRILVGIGLISYSAYLWHQPLLAFAKHRYLNELGAGMAGALVACALALGYATYRLVETPFRNRQRFARRQIVWYSATGAAFFIALGLVWQVQNGYGGYYYATLSDPQKHRLQLIAAHTSYDMYDFMVDDGNCQFWGRTVTPALETRFSACAARYGQGVIVTGDSHAMNFYNVMAKARVYPFVMGVSQGYCRIDTNKDYCQFGHLEHFLRQHATRIKTVVYHQTGNPLLLGERGDAMAPNKFDGHAPLRIDVAAIERVMRDLNWRDVPVRYVWVGPWAEAQVPGRELLMRQPAMNQVSLAAFRALDAAIAERFRASGGNKASYVSALDAFALPDQSLWHKECLVFKDLNHLSRCGEEHLAKTSGKEFWTAVIGPGQRP